MNVPFQRIVWARFRAFVAPQSTRRLLLHITHQHSETQPNISHRSSSQPPGRVLRHLPVSVQEQLPSSPRVSVLQPAPEHLPRSSHHSPILSPVLQLRHVLLPQSVRSTRKTSTVELWCTDTYRPIINL